MIPICISQILNPFYVLDLIFELLSNFKAQVFLDNEHSKVYNEIVDEKTDIIR